MEAKRSQLTEDQAVEAHGEIARLDRELNEVLDLIRCDHGLFPVTEHLIVAAVSFRKALEAIRDGQLDTTDRRTPEVTTGVVADFIAEARRLTDELKIR